MHTFRLASIFGVILALFLLVICVGCSTHADSLIIRNHGDIYRFHDIVYMDGGGGLVIYDKDNKLVGEFKEYQVITEPEKVEPHSPLLPPAGGPQ